MFTYHQLAIEEESLVQQPGPRLHQPGELRAISLELGTRSSNWNDVILLRLLDAHRRHFWGRSTRCSSTWVSPHTQHFFFGSSLRRLQPRWLMCFITHRHRYLWLWHLHTLRGTRLRRLLRITNDKRWTLRLGHLSRPEWRHRLAYLAFFHPVTLSSRGLFNPGLLTLLGYSVPFVPWNEQHTSDVPRTKITYRGIFRHLLGTGSLLQGGLA